ncbi:MAG: carbohydrate binding domain-containing protein [Chthonomonadaceae bacterium]|nr:carbohydrate binding domain-containing protein [Chthonomonadaceae bacterium]
MKRAFAFALLWFGCAAAVAAPNLTNPSFESANLGRNVWLYRPTTITGWTLSNNSGACNGRSPWGSRAQDGQQYCFIQSAGNPGRISQSVSGFVPGQTYRVRHWMQNRSGSAANQIDVQIDNVSIGTPTAGYAGIWIEYTSDWFTATNLTHVLSFVGQSTTNDFSCILDNVAIESGPVAFGPLSNTSFESPDYGTGRMYDNPKGSTLAWTFAPGSGIANGFTNVGDAAALGQQYAYIGQSTSVSQPVGQLDPTKEYAVRFSAVKARNTPAQQITGSFDNLLFNESSVPGSTWSEFATRPFEPTATEGRFSFGGGTVSAAISLIDAVRWFETTPLPLTNMSIDRGAIVSGDLDSLRQSDDQRLVLKPALVLQATDPPIALTVSGHAPSSHLDYIAVRLEGFASSNGLTAKMEIYDFEDGIYLDGGTQLVRGTDRVTAIVHTEDSNAFVNPLTGETRVRLNLRVVGPLNTADWRYHIDRVAFSIEEFGGQN